MDFTPAAAAYVAGYCFKKVGRLFDFFHYSNLTPEFVTMSRGKRKDGSGRGIGADFFSKFYSDIFPNDHYVTADGSIAKPPRYFYKLLEKAFPGDYSQIKSLRIADPVTGEIRPELSQAELDVRAELFRAKFKRQRRFLEDL